MNQHSRLSGAALSMVLTTSLLLLLSACNNKTGIFSSAKTPHEAYAEKIEKAGLNTSSLGASWLAAAKTGMHQAVSIELPYQETGYFEQSDPQSAGYRFNLRQGEIVQILIKTIPDSSLILFADLWQPRLDKEWKHLSSADTSQKMISYEAKEAGEYVVRIQPELLQNVEYNLQIKTAPSLAFPVHEANKPVIGSLWGTNRDGGRRSHEGIDIFSKKGTPLLAAATGTISRVGDNNLGGKVIFLRPEKKDYSLYYAHLDSQLVQQGQQVNVGDTIGLMGNTGNARTTPPHLHFGIYARGGAVDPLPYVEYKRKSPPAVIADREPLRNFLRTRKAAPIYSEASTSSSILHTTAVAEIVQITAVTANWYKVKSGLLEGFMPAGSLTNASWKNQTLAQTVRLLHHPDSLAPAKALIPSGTAVQLMGIQSGFLLVKAAEKIGWVME